MRSFIYDDLERAMSRCDGVHISISTTDDVKAVKLIRLLHISPHHACFSGVSHVALPRHHPDFGDSQEPPHTGLQMNNF